MGSYTVFIENMDRPQSKKQGQIVTRTPNLKKRGGEKKMALRWNDDLYVGVSWIDDQHQQLFKRINNLTEGMKEGKGTEEIRDLVNFLKKYSVDHFGNEEKEMKEKKYPKYAAHKNQHDKFITQVEKLKRIIEEKGIDLTLTLKVQDFMNKWWINHIKKVDRALGTFLME